MFDEFNINDKFFLIVLLGAVLLLSGIIFSIIVSPDNVCKRACNDYEGMSFVDSMVRDDKTFCECTSPRQKYLIIEV